MIGQLINTKVNDRLIGSVTMAVLAAQKFMANGTHSSRSDVKETCRLFKFGKQQTVIRF